VVINIAGVDSTSQGSSNSGKETLLLPVAEKKMAQELVAKVLPQIEVSDIEWHFAPKRAVRRSPIQWRNLAMGWNADSFAARRGRITRHLMVIPHARTQSVHMTQGPWERALNLASLHIDTTPGPVTICAHHLDAELVSATLWEQAARIT
jgi:putative membrane protein